MELPSRVEDKDDDDDDRRTAQATQDGDDADPDDKLHPSIMDDEKAILKYQEEQQAHMSLLLDSLTPEQREQHDKFRNSRLDLQEIRKIMQAVTGVTTNPSKKVQTVMAGVAKVFAGQIVEEARRANPGNDPLEPHHIRSALRRLRALGQDPSLPAPAASSIVGRRRAGLWR